MKFKGVEGSSEEINNFFRDNGLNLTDFFERPKPSLPNWHFITSALLFALAVAVLVLRLFSSEEWAFLVFLGGLAGAIWLTAALQIRFENVWASVFVLFGLFVILLMAHGQITPTEALREFEKLKE